MIVLNAFFESNFSFIFNRCYYTNIEKKSVENKNLLNRKAFLKKGIEK